MKFQKNEPKGQNKRIHRHQRQRDSDQQVTDMLKLCLQKICELQAEINDEENVHDAEAAGYAACAVETLRFLTNQGLPPSHPMVKTLTEKLLKKDD
ncbi:unnamed protein product [Brassicogethes aeneus]|uniref:Uncharacterized protein n=1 Tax=Brassicogethes aeneus TaxID=1431903 RepID=A0A9P0BJJ9_BRAAE|nr:unnamed protein product [Brassicogethes aeneus]